MFLYKTSAEKLISKRVKAIIFLLTLISVSSYAQKSLITSAQIRNNLEVKVGYFGNIMFDNGLNAGAEYLWKEKKRIRTKENYEKTVTHQYLFNASLGYTTNFTLDTEDALYAHCGLIWRRIGPKRWQFHVELNPLGLHRSLLPQTYEVKGTNVSRVSNPTRTYYAPSIAIGFGKLRKSQRRTGWYLNLNISYLTSYNADTYPNISFQYGQRFSLKKKIKTSRL